MGVDIVCADDGLAEACVWTGAVDTNWCDGANWQESLAPDDGDDVLIPAAAARNPSIPAGVWPAADGRYGAFTVESGRTVTCLGDTTVTNEASGGGIGGDGKIHGIGVTLRCSDATINGTLSANQQGFPLNQGPGMDARASHGGGPLAYGNVRAPTALGSGTVSATGGGAIAIHATGTITVNGTITANGHMTTGNRPSSGGSVWLQCQTLAGGSAGAIQARGGGGKSQWVGNGGRISLEWQERTYSGGVDAGCDGWWTVGQNGGTYGQPGSLWEPNRKFPHDGGTIIMAEGSYQYYFPDGAGAYAWDELVVNNQWIELRGDAAVTIRALTITNDGVFYLNGAAAALGPGDVRLQGARVACLFLPAGEYAFGSVAIAANGRIMVSGDQAAVNHSSGGTLAVPHGAGAILRCAALAIASGGSIDVSLQGFDTWRGPGPAMGAGHGGRGISSSATYGMISRPTALGSGGHVEAAYGGGAVAVFADTVDLAAGGAIRADGGSHGSGCGAGGSIWIRAEIMSGGGTLAACGGDSSARYGGGGRIAVETGPESTFDGVIDVRGGLSGTVPGGESGTVFRASATVPRVFGGLRASPVDLISDYAVNSAPTGMKVERSVTRWGRRVFAWADRSCDFGGDGIPNAATYTLNGLEAGRKAAIRVDGTILDTAQVAMDGTLAISAVALEPAAAVSVELATDGTLLLVR